MTRFRLIVNLLAIAVIVVAGITFWSRSHAQHRGEAAADPLAILDRRVAEVDLAGTSLPEAAEALSKAAGVRITVDPAAAEIAGRVDAAEITLGGLTLQDNLRRLISRFNGLSYVVERGGIRITTLAQSPPVVRIYDVRDIYQKNILDMQQQMKGVPPPATMPVPAVGLFGGSAVPLSAQVYRTQAQIVIDAIDQIASLIRDTVDREDWQENGGTIGMIEEVGGFLVILQTPVAHREIAHLLETIRRADSMEWRDNPPGGQR